MHDRILIVDFGAQYTQLIARRVREAKVYCEIHPWDVDDAFVRSFGAKGVILSGSHLSAYDEATAKAPQAVFELGVLAISLKPGGSAVTLSPWLIQTFSMPWPSAVRWSSIPSRRRVCPRARTSAWPNSRTFPGSTLPPSWCAIVCMP